MRINPLAAMSLALIFLAGCETLGIESKRVDYKSASYKVPSLEIPPDLTKPKVEDRYSIPNDNDELVANYSDYAKSGEVRRTQGSVAVLPQTQNVRLERNGSQRWLVVGDKAENLWPLLKAFWQENGFVVTVDNPEAGVMETDWAENRAKIPLSPVRKLLGKVLDKLYSTDELERYRLRLERSPGGKSTEIYITQYTKEMILTSSKNDFHWQSKPNDPETEAIMLQMLMTKLGVSEERAKLVAAAAAKRPTKLAQPDLSGPPSRLQTQSNGQKVIVLNEPFEKSWRKVGLALERADIGVEDRDRANGVYFVNITPPPKEKSWLDSLAFWRSAEGSAKPVRFQVSVRESGEGCEVSVTDEKSESTPAAQRLLDTLYQSLNK